MRLRLLLLQIVILFNSINSFAVGYYVDALNGNDKNNGLSHQNAWQTLEKVNQQQFRTGDKILLKGGQTFEGSIHFNSISGNINHPILISSYGAQKAIVFSGDTTAFYAHNCHFTTVKNLIFKGAGRLAGNKTSGLDFRQCSNLTIDSVEVSGYLFSGVNTSGGGNIRITNVYAHNNGFCGIHVTSDRSGRDNSRDKSVRNVYIGYSTVENNPGCPVIKNNHSGNGILVGGVTNATIEYCEAMNHGWDMPREGNGPVGIWTYQSDSVVIQHCYAHHNKTSAKGSDGGGFDFDGGVTNSVMQYNLSAYNEGAGYGMFQYADAKQWNNNTVRYNISYHDGIKHGQCGIFMWCDPAAIQMKNLHAYNNTIVNKYGHGVNFLPGNYENFVFENNIFLVTDTTKEEFTGGEFTGARFKNNLYWNSFSIKKSIKQPKVSYELNAIIADPLMVLPTDDNWLTLSVKKINSIRFFKLKSTSPALNAGNEIKKSGNRDYWSKRIKKTGAINMGADQSK